MPCAPVQRGIVCHVCVCVCVEGEGEGTLHVEDRESVGGSEARGMQYQWGVLQAYACMQVKRVRAGMQADSRCHCRPIRRDPQPLPCPRLLLNFQGDLEEMTLVAFPPTTTDLSGAVQLHSHCDPNRGATGLGWEGRGFGGSAGGPMRECDAPVPRTPGPCTRQRRVSLCL